MTNFRHIRIERYRRPSRLRDAYERLCLWDPPPWSVGLSVVVLGLVAYACGRM